MASPAHPSAKTRRNAWKNTVATSRARNHKRNKTRSCTMPKQKPEPKRVEKKQDQTLRKKRKANNDRSDNNNNNNNSIDEGEEEKRRRDHPESDEDDNCGSSTSSSSSSDKDENKKKKDKITTTAILLEMVERSQMDVIMVRRMDKSIIPSPKRKKNRKIKGRSSRAGKPGKKKKRGSLKRFFTELTPIQRIRFISLLVVAGVKLTAMILAFALTV